MPSRIGFARGSSCAAEELALLCQDRRLLFPRRELVPLVVHDEGRSPGDELIVGELPSLRLNELFESLDFRS